MLTEQEMRQYCCCFTEDCLEKLTMIAHASEKDPEAAND